MAKMGIIFNRELDEIKNKRLELGKDKDRRSTKELTNLITKHNYWKIIKKEIIQIESSQIKESLEVTE